MKVIAIDPGDVSSAAVLIDAYKGVPIARRQAHNSLLKTWLKGCWRVANEQHDLCELVIEFTPPYTMTMGNGRSFVPSQVVDTAIEIGKFMQFWEGLDEPTPTLLSRLDVKKHLLGKTNGTDAMIRAALMDRFGGERLAVGAKKCLECMGRGTSGFELEHCSTCEGRLCVDGKKPFTKKKCPTCKGKGTVRGDKALCNACRGAKYALPPGPMHGITKDLYAALAVGLTYCDQKKLIPTD